MSRETAFEASHKDFIEAFFFPFFFWWGYVGDGIVLRATIIYTRNIFRVRAWRGGQWIAIPVSSMLPGDVISLKSGVGSAGGDGDGGADGKVGDAVHDNIVLVFMPARVFEAL